ncbi:hypothetical protein ASG01_08985 [Chryseobacterium sp. Leaf180]|uniref:hypothetical protein n=1 Tax=Chryseobacterium sp. Leaf180 TaxID=1736289 RepID=UPI0006FF0CBE|nr:hypothetical protein [Chryseobacterium sp. Leaf180]KQR93321.1 hypothetical protein ASG01_08985 [Chryseobacterium sp. Leaf180]
MNTLERELEGLRQKQYRLERKQRKENEEIWSRIKLLEKINTSAEESGVDAAQKLSPNVQILANKAAQRRGYGK